MELVNQHHIRGFYNKTQKYVCKYLNLDSQKYRELGEISHHSSTVETVKNNAGKQYQGAEL